jgi:hypothetical protein
MGAVSFEECGAGATAKGEHAQQNAEHPFGEGSNDDRRTASSKAHFFRKHISAVDYRCGRGGCLHGLRELTGECPGL